MELSNRKAYYEYAIESKNIAGMVLTGTEIKSIREGKVSFNDSYCLFNEGELYVKSLHIAEYSFGTINNHDPNIYLYLLYWIIIFYNGHVWFVLY